MDLGPVKRQRKLGGQIPVGEQAGSKGCPGCETGDSVTHFFVLHKCQAWLTEALSSVLRPSAHSLGDRPTLTSCRQQQIKFPQIEQPCSSSDTNVTQARPVLLQPGWLHRAKAGKGQLLCYPGDSHKRAGL